MSTFHWHPHCCDGWRIGQHESAGDVQEVLQVYPNPVVKTTIVSFSLDQAQHVSLILIDMSGRLVSILADQVFDEGISTFTWSTEHIENRVYFIKFNSIEKQEMIKLVVTK